MNQCPYLLSKTIQTLKGHNKQHSDHNIWVKIFQTELMSEIYSENPVRAIGEVLLMEFS